MALSDGRMISEAYDRFVNALAANPSSFHPEHEQFAPAVLSLDRSGLFVEEAQITSP
jgi:hypothetical protein